MPKRARKEAPLRTMAQGLEEVEEGGCKVSKQGPSRQQAWTSTSSSRWCGVDRWPHTNPT